jgi:hypothetical protein
LPFDPLAFLELAKNLIDGGSPQERELRTAVGRAYYAVFLLARDKMGIRARRDVHKLTRDALKARPGYRSTGEKLSQLGRLRSVADYELVPADPNHRNWPRNWTTARALVDQILPRIS